MKPAVANPPAPQPPAAQHTAKVPVKPAAKPAAKPIAKPAAAHPPLAPVDRRLKTRIRRGSEAVGPVIDLHGLKQAQAHLALFRFLAACQRDGAATALVVTGKGGPSPDTPDLQRGVLRRMTPHWLSSPEARTYVIGFEEAGPGLGGGGALLVRIRRDRALRR